MRLLTAALFISCSLQIQLGDVFLLNGGADSVSQLSDKLFNNLDYAKAGKISIEETEKRINAAKSEGYIKEGQVHTSPALMDTNGDGFVDRQEFHDYISDGFRTEVKASETSGVFGIGMLSRKAFIAFLSTSCPYTDSDMAWGRYYSCMKLTNTSNPDCHKWLNCYDESTKSYYPDPSRPTPTVELLAPTQSPVRVEVVTSQGGVSAEEFRKIAKNSIVYNAIGIILAFGAAAFWIIAALTFLSATIPIILGVIAPMIMLSISVMILLIIKTVKDVKQRDTALSASQ